MRTLMPLVVVVPGLVVSVASAQTVDRLWATNCATCHASDGRGGGAGTRTLLEPRFGPEGGAGGGDGAGIRTDRALFDAIKNGVPETAMPSFGGAISDEQIWGLVNYLRELQARDQRRRGGAPRPNAQGVYSSRRQDFRVETVAEAGLSVPWGIEFPTAGPLSGTLLITNRPGDVVVYRDGRPIGVVKGTPAVRNRGQGGLMDITLHPDFATNGWVYLAFSEAAGDRGAGMTTLVRGKIVPEADGFAWKDQQTIFRAREEHFTGSDIHFGCKIVFDPADPGILYFGIGERGRGDDAQNLSRPNGKVHRLHDDGRVPRDNPFVGREGVYESIWSYGHRNPQGLCFDLEGRLWDTEHGPRGGDELNEVLKGRNYGWPIVSYGINYNGLPYVTPWPDTAGERAARLDIVMPVDRWLPSIGACGLGVVRGEAFAAWRGDLLAGGLSGSNVDRVRVRAGALVEREEILHGIGRVRDVECGPDGTIYVVLNDPDKVIRLTPVASGDAPAGGR